MLTLLPLLLACIPEPDFPGLGPQLYADQEGQEVLLWLEIYEGGDPGLEQRYDLVHTYDDEDERFVLRRHRFQIEDAEDQGVACVSTGGGDDTASPDLGSCEGAEPTCSAECVPWYGFLVLDPCQGAGQTAYELRRAGEDDPITVERFYVVDMGAECENNGCSSTGRTTPLPWLALLGLAALGCRRRD
jgi:hypothetical protein